MTEFEDNVVLWWSDDGTRRGTWMYRHPHYAGAHRGTWGSSDYNNSDYRAVYYTALANLIRKERTYA